MKIYRLLLILLLTVTACNIFSSKTDELPYINYSEGQTSNYEYTFSVQHPDTTEFIEEVSKLVNTEVVKSDDEIIVDDTLLSDLINIKLTVVDNGTITQHQNVWYRYDDGFFTEYAYTQPITAGFSHPKLLNSIHHDHKKQIQYHLKKFSPERMITGNFYIEDFNDDSICLRSDPRLVHPHEFEIGKEWTTFSDPWLSKSTITDEKDLIINDSPYSSYEVKTENFFNSNEFSYHSYFDSHGLVKRIILLEQTFTNPDGESIGKGYTRSVVKRIGFSE